MQNNKNSSHFSQLSKDECDLYARHLLLSKIKIEGQERLKKAKILFVGAGGLAAGSLLYLVAAGVGTVGIIDNDMVEKSNLQRQVIYSTNDINKLKILSAKEKIELLNTQCKILLYQSKIQRFNAYKIIQSYDIILDSTDNTEARHVISNWCTLLHKTHIYAAVFEFQGQISVLNYRGGCNYEDIHPHLTQNHANNCEHQGIIGVLPGLVGMIQALESIKIITGAGQILNNYMLAYNSLQTSFQKKDLRYIHHKGNKQLKNNILKQNKTEISISVLTKIQKYFKDQFYLIDLNDKKEYNVKHINKAVNIPIRKIYHSHNIRLLKFTSMTKLIVIYCNDNSKIQAVSKIMIAAHIKHWQLYKIIK